jgi:diadenylate cyclase
MRIGQGNLFKFSREAQSYDLDAVMNAAEVLAGSRRGGLIVLGRSIGLKNYIETGTKLDADISSSLILTIFGHDTQLHDGAVIIEQGKIAAGGCFLPLSEQPDIRRSFGTRHRAALGLAEETDAVIIIVSEERGAMSLAFDGMLIYDLTAQEMLYKLKELFNLTSTFREEETEEKILEE